MKDLDKPFLSESFGMGQTAIELNKNKVDDVSRALGGSNIEANVWLPFAAAKYNLSRKIEDYVLVPVPSMITDIPNTNGDSVTRAEFLEFDPQLGMQAFKTFRGKPTFSEHDNKDIVKAKGVILDVFLRPLKRFGNGKYHKLVMLLGYDRTKDPLLVNSILTGENNAYSVGFYYKSYGCSICGQVVGQSLSAQPCTHTRPRQGTYMMDDGSKRLVYRNCKSIIGFETSNVLNPAYVSAISPVVMDPSIY